MEDQMQVPEIKMKKIGAPKVHYIADCMFDYLRSHSAMNKSTIPFDDRHSPDALKRITAFEEDMLDMIEMAKDGLKWNSEEWAGRASKMSSGMNFLEKKSLYMIMVILMYMGGIDKNFDYREEWRNW